MKKAIKILSAVLLSQALAGVLQLCFAAATASSGAAEAKADGTWFFTLVNISAVIALALAAFGCGLAQGNAISKAVEGISRQPEASTRIQTILLIGLAFIESLVIYVLVFGLILLFANPFTSAFLGK